MTEWAAALQLTAEGIVGPTTAGGLPAFQWEGQFNHVAHLGQPELFNFAFQRLARRDHIEFIHIGPKTRM